MRKFFTQISSWLLAVIVLSFIVTTVTFNILLAVVKPALVKNATAHFHHDVSIRHMIYLFPDRIIFKKFVIDEKGEGGANDPFVLPTVTGKFSILKTLLNRKILFSEIYIHKAQGSWPLFCRFISKNWTEIIDMIGKSPQGDVKVKLSKGRFLLSDLDDGRRYLLADGACSVKGNVVRGEGELHFEKYQARDERTKRVSQQALLNYQFNTEWAGDIIFLNSFVMEGDNIYCKLWGDFQKQQLQLNGFTFLNSKESPKGTQGSINIFDRVKVLLGALKGRSSTIEGFPAGSIYLTDIDSLIDINLPSLEIKKFDFNFNNAPISLHGKIFATDPVVLELGLTAFPVNVRHDKQGRLLRSDINIKGHLQEDLFYGDGTLNLKFDPGRSAKGLEGIDVFLNEASLDYAQYPLVTQMIKKGSALWRVKEGERKISLNDMAGSADLGGADDVKLMNFKSGFYDGVLEGKIWIDTGYLPFHINSELVVEEAETDQLDELLPFFSKVSGRANSTMTFKNFPEMKLQGDINIKNGRLKDFRFFRWLAGTFALPSLKEVDFDETHVQFYVGSEKTGIEEVALSSQDLKLTGYYYVNKHSLVSSKLSLFLGRPLLGASPKFKAILKLFPEDMNYLDFNFQLSGNKSAVNFLWMPSASKSTIEEAIPDFIERSIERKIDEKLDGAEPAKKADKPQAKNP